MMYFSSSGLISKYIDFDLTPNKIVRKKITNFILSNLFLFSHNCFIHILLNRNKIDDHLKLKKELVQ